MQLDGFRSLKTDIDTEMDAIHQKLKSVSVKITDNLKSEANPEGLLTGGRNSYLNCLKLKYRELEDLFQQDDAFW